MTARSGRAHCGAAPPVRLRLRSPTIDWRLFDMMPVLFINCDAVPFLDRIISLRKPWETRTRNTLRALVGHRVLLAETGRGHRPVVRCSAVVGEPLVIRSRAEWKQYRSACCVPAKSRYDWQSGTKVKYLYPLTGVVACHPFTPPEDVRHGRVWMEYHNN